MAYGPSDLVVITMERCGTLEVCETVTQEMVHCSTCGKHFGDFGYYLYILYRQEIHSRDSGK